MRYFRAVYRNKCKKVIQHSFETASKKNLLSREILSLNFNRATELNGNHFCIYLHHNFINLHPVLSSYVLYFT